MIKFIKRDFRSVKEALGFMIGKDVPVGIAILYYIIVGLIALPLMPFIWIYYLIEMRKIRKIMKEYEAE